MSISFFFINTFSSPKVESSLYNLNGASNQGNAETGALEFLFVVIVFMNSIPIK